MIIKRTKNLTAKDWDELLERFYKSGLSGAAFVAQEGIRDHCLRYRLKLARAAQQPTASTPTGGFVEVHQSPTPTSPPVSVLPLSMDNPPASKPSTLRAELVSSETASPVSGDKTAGQPLPAKAVSRPDVPLTGGGPETPVKVAQAPALRLHIGALCLEFSALPDPDYVASLARRLSC